MAGLRPKYTITPDIAGSLMRIEAAREAVGHLPMTASVLVSLRETARLFSTHYSTMIEGNRLTQEQVHRILEAGQHFPGRERDEREVLGYYAAMARVEQLVAENEPIAVRHIQMLHALVMGGGTSRKKPTPFRDVKNVIRDGRTRRIVYLPPRSAEVPKLMQELVDWLSASATQALVCPIRAAIAHYQFATIHPYFDGNGRTARLLTTLVLHLGGYGLKGLYSLEEYYARNLSAYYEALSIGPSHNYYDGRARSDITRWVAYFCKGAAESFENVRKRAEEAATGGLVDDSLLLRTLDPRQRRALELFRKSELVTSHDVARLFTVSPRTARLLLADWVAKGFVVVLDPAKKSRQYGLSKQLRSMLI